MNPKRFGFCKGLASSSLCRVDMPLFLVQNFGKLLGRNCYFGASFNVIL